MLALALLQVEMRELYLAQRGLAEYLESGGIIGHSHRLCPVCRLPAICDIRARLPNLIYEVMSVNWSPSFARFIVVSEVNELGAAKLIKDTSDVLRDIGDTVNADPVG